MAAPSPVFLLLAALICSMIGRGFLFRAALSISKAWGIAVLCVPLAPFFFRRNYKELAHEGQNWRTGATILAVLFFAITGSSGSVSELWDLVPENLRPASLVEETEPEADDAGEVADATAVPATPMPPSYSERVAANQREFARLGEVYDTLKLERGYLRKHDREGIEAYNLLAAKYQADLAKARTEQKELNNLVAKK
jgi:hypothetical protein